MWSTKYEKCVGCGTTEIRHWAKGYCNRCYPKYIVRKTGYFNRSDRIGYKAFIQKIAPKISAKMKLQKSLSSPITQRLDKDLLSELYHNKNMSLGDIGKMFNCSRVHIYNLCKKYNVRVKSKSEARGDAYSLGKKLRYHPVNKNFFEKWSNEMAYVLGFICADGCIGHRLDVLTISQKEIEILEKIKRILKAEQNIVHYKHQDIYHLPIGSAKIVKDLLKLGITPHKSLTLKLPNMPLEYTGHFIRGYFDGDGSICKSGNCWRVSFTTGSDDFIKAIKENLEKMALVSQQKIYKHKTANAYNLYYHSREDLNKIYNFFYDNYTLDNSLYLRRKYGKFVEAVN